MKLSIIIPVRNEELLIKKIVDDWQGYIAIIKDEVETRLVVNAFIQKKGDQLEYLTQTGGVIQFNEELPTLSLPRSNPLVDAGIIKKNIEDNQENFKQIKNNINEFIGINEFRKRKVFSLKDILIFNNKVFNHIESF